MADIVVSVGSSPVVNTMNGDEYQIYKILENIENQLSTKVDKVTGKDLSSNDYTTAEKNKLSELPSKTELDNDLSGKEDSANKITTLDKNSTDAQYPSAKCVYDELVKKADMQNSEGGFQAAGGVSTGTGIAIGKDTTPVDNGVVIGRGARAGDGTAIGDGAYASAGGSVGRGAYTHNGGAIGSGAGSFGDGGAVGKGAFTADGFAGGKTAQTENSGMPIDAIQLGTGTNPNAKTLQIYDYQLMDADGHIPNDRMPTKADKTTVTTSTETTASITLADNREFVFTSDVSKLKIEFDYSANTLISSVVFNTGETAPEVILPAKSIYYIGTSCGGYNSFTPVANRHYTMIFTYDSNQAICYVSAIPVSQVVLFSAADTNEVTVANNETVAEEPESVTETSESAEEETEPNEVI